MSQRFAITINDDGTVQWHGVDTGKTKVLDMNEKKKLIALHIAGHTTWHGVGRLYGEARIGVYEYEDGPSEREIFLTDLFGELDWKSRGAEWRPKQ